MRTRAGNASCFISAYNGCFENYAIQEFIDEKIDAPKTVSSQGKYAEKGI